MNTLVLGGNGFIGSWVTKCLLDNGFEVTAVVRINPNGHWRIQWLSERYENLSTITVGEFSFPQIHQSLSSRRFHALINCIGDGINPTHQNMSQLWMANVEVQYTAAKLACALRIPRLIVAGSGFEYGFSESEHYFDEAAPLRPTTPYAATKVAGFHTLKQTSQNCDICVDYLRIFGVLGIGDNSHRLLPYAIRTLIKGQELKLTDGRQVRDFVAVEDVAYAFVNVLRWNEPHSFEIFNVSSGQPRMVRNIIESICRHLKVSESLLAWGAIPNRPSEGRFWIGDNSKITKIVEWYPEKDLEMLVQAACDYYKMACY